MNQLRKILEDPPNSDCKLCQSKSSNYCESKGTCVDYDLFEQRVREELVDELALYTMCWSNIPSDKLQSLFLFLKRNILNGAHKKQKV